MGNRLDKSSPRHGKPRNGEAERESRESYENRAIGRPRQRWNPASKAWEKAKEE